MRKTLLDLCKRVGAAISALCIMCYSLVTAPLFGVHAVDVDIAVFKSLLSGAVSVASSLVPGLGAITAFAMPFYEDIVFDDSAPLPYTLPRPIPDNTYIFKYQYPDGTVNDIYCYDYSWDYSQLDSTAYGVMATNIICCPDYSLDIQVLPDPDWIASSDRSNMSIQLGFSYTRSTNVFSFHPSIHCTDSSGVTPVFGVRLIYYFSNGESFFITSTATGNDSDYPHFQFYRRGDTYTYSFASPSQYISYLRSVYNPSNYRANWVCGYDPVSLASVPSSIIPSSEYPPSGYITSNTELVTYYDYNIRNYASQYYTSYPEIENAYITYNNYYELNPPTSDPTESPTGGGGTIIIDPFTLPPEWLESNAELDTEHYTMPYTDLVQSPWDDLLSYVTYAHSNLEDSASGGGGGSGGNTIGMFPAEMTVISTIDQFQAFAVGLLDRSGLLAVFASLIAVGLIIRFISIK